MIKRFYILILIVLSSCVLYIALFNCKFIFSKEFSSNCKIENITITNGHGNVKIKFQLSDRSSVEYIKAQYKSSKGVIKYLRASKYMNEIYIDGLDSNVCDQINLYLVYKNGNISNPVLIKVNPKSPNYKLVFDSLRVTPTFDGIQIRSINKHIGRITIVSLIDTIGKGEFVKQHSYYTTDSIIEYQIKNLGNKKINSAFFVHDNFENRSDTLFLSISPKKEQQIDRRLFSGLNFLEDAKCIFDTNISMIWDGDKNPYKWPSFYTSENVNIPQNITFSIGSETKLNRIVIYPRRENGFYDKGNLKDFEVWATNKPILEKTWDNWEKLATFHVIKPSGILNEQFTKNDDASAETGWSFTFPYQDKKYKYLRIRNLSNWQGSYFIQLAQVEIWGQ